MAGDVDAEDAVAPCDRAQARRDDGRERSPVGRLARPEVRVDLPRERDWLDKLAGVPDTDGLIGDESPRAIVEILHEYLRVPISSH